MLSVLVLLISLDSPHWEVLYIKESGFEYSFLASATLLSQSINIPVPQIKLISINKLTSTFLPMATLKVVELLSILVLQGMWNRKMAGKLIDNFSLSIFDMDSSVTAPDRVVWSYHVSLFVHTILCTSDG